MATQSETRKKPRSYNKRNIKQDAIFLQAIAQGRGTMGACRASGYSRSSVINWRTEDSEFNERYQDAKATYIEDLEHEADRRAVEGVVKPVFYQGTQCGEIREYSDTLLMFRLKALDPNNYKDRQEVKHEGHHSHQIINEDQRQLVEDIKHQLEP